MKAEIKQSRIAVTRQVVVSSLTPVLSAVAPTALCHQHSTAQRSAEAACAHPLLCFQPLHPSSREQWLCKLTCSCTAESLDYPAGCYQQHS